MALCKICNNETKPVFKTKIIEKYKIQYYKCSQCGFIQTEDPYWLNEVYEESINISDTGILSRNLQFSKITSILIYYLYKKNAKFVDFAGGYGIFVRLMRDIGYDFYWNDKYSTNLVARSFEYNSKDKIDLITCFEAFEHFENPILEIESMLKISKNILFSTELLPNPVPHISDWWYYGPDHGQHISFYSIETLRYLADKYSLNLLSNGVTIHLLTEKRINSTLFNILLKLHRLGISGFISRKMNSLTVMDMNSVKGK